MHTRDMDSDFVGDKLQAEASATASQRPHELTDYPEPREEVLTPNDNLVAAGLGRNASVCRQEHSIICANPNSPRASSFLGSPERCRCPGNGIIKKGELAHYRPRTWRGPDDGKLVDFSQWRMRHSFEQEDIGAFVELLNSLSLSFGLGLLFIDNAETLCTEICQLDQASWSTKERRTRTTHRMDYLLDVLEYRPETSHAVFLHEDGGDWMLFVHPLTESEIFCIQPFNWDITVDVWHQYVIKQFLVGRPLEEKPRKMKMETYEISTLEVDTADDSWSSGLRCVWWCFGAAFNIQDDRSFQEFPIPDILQRLSDLLQQFLGDRDGLRLWSLEEALGDWTADLWEWNDDVGPDLVVALRSSPVKRMRSHDADIIERYSKNVAFTKAVLARQRVTDPLSLQGIAPDEIRTVLKDSELSAPVFWYALRSLRTRYVRQLASRCRTTSVASAYGVDQIMKNIPSIEGSTEHKVLGDYFSPTDSPTEYIIIPFIQDHPCVVRIALRVKIVDIIMVTSCLARYERVREAVANLLSIGTRPGIQSPFTGIGSSGWIYKTHFPDTAKDVAVEDGPRWVLAYIAALLDVKEAFPGSTRWAKSIVTGRQVRLLPALLCAIQLAEPDELSKAACFSWGDNGPSTLSAFTDKWGQLPVSGDVGEVQEGSLPDTNGGNVIPVIGSGQNLQAISARGPLVQDKNSEGRTIHTPGEPTFGLGCSNTSPVGHLRNFT